MSVRHHHIAQINVGRLVAPLDHPSIAGFVEALDPVNASADAASGFVWRLQTEEGNATALQVDPDPLVIVNVSVWESIEALDAFAYGDEGHLTVLRARRSWFERPVEAHTALWWVARGEIPTVEAAMARLRHLREHGPTERAFTFTTRFPPPPAPDA